MALLRGRHFPGVRKKLDQLAEFARTEGVDLALSTGDFTVLGTHGELKEARERMQQFVELPLGVVVVPGNHDRYAPETFRQDRFQQYFGDLLVSDAGEGAEDESWPLLRFPGPHVAVLALDSAVAHRNPLHAWGKVPELQLSSLEKRLEDPRLQDRFVFVLVHHAPRLPNGEPDGDGHGLRNAEQLLRACSRIRRGAVLFGHVHRCYHLELPGLAAGLFGSGSATMLGAEGSWLFDVDGGQVKACRVRHRRGRYTLDSEQRIDC